MNNREWTDQQKHRIVEIDKEERTRGKHFMKRVKERWDTEFPTVVRTAQNLIDNAKRFQKEGWGRSTVENGEVAAAQIPHPKDQEKRSLEWTTEMKVALITFDNEERAKGKGFMKRVKERWDQYFPEYRHASWQKLRDNAARFKKEPEVMNLILVRRRNEIQQEEISREENLPVENQVTRNDIPNNEVDINRVVDEEADGLTENDKKLERFFQVQIEAMEHCSLLQLEPREKLPKVKLTKEIESSANRILDRYLIDVNTIPEITDKVYAMGKAIAFKLGVKQPESNTTKKKDANGGNRRERKLKKEIKELRQWIARTSNELYTRKIRRKATKREKEILNQIKVQMDKELTSNNLRIAKEQWIDKLRYKKVKLEKCIEKRKRKQDNIKFQRDQKGFFKTLEGDQTREGRMPEIEKFVEFWGGIWEKNERTPNMSWMEEVKRLLSENVTVVNEFNINSEGLKKEISKRKSWTAPGIDGIQNFWWKKLVTAQKALLKVFETIKLDNNMIPVWWPTGRTVLLPKTKDLSDEKNYRPITCLNTSYKILTGLIAKYMRDHALVNKIWDEGQLGAVEGVLGTVDQLIIDRCIMEEVKQYHRNLAVAFYDYKKAYDKVHHDWMLRVYE